MIPWIPYTFVRTVLFFMGGIVLGMYGPDMIAPMFATVLAGLLLTFYFVIVFSGRRLRRAFNPGGLALPLVALLGYIHVTSQMESGDPDHMINHTGEIPYYQAVITRFAEEKAHTWKMEAEILQIHDGVGWVKKAGRIILYLSKDDFPNAFVYGDVLLLKGQPRRPDPPGNPGEFDYRAYLESKNIYHQHFVRAKEAVKIGYAPRNRFVAFAFRGRAWAESTLNRFVHGHREQAIASALALGVTDGLDNELRTAYAATGTMHILAVSGMHVSILYLILLWILKPLNRIPGGRWIVAFVALLLLWLYALVTGLSPSVLRAVAMFSFVALARPWARSTNIYNTLAVSAFCLLLFDPLLIRSVGFQLSYFAVLGIIYLYPRIVLWWEPKHWITTKIWQLAAVSIAAQVATFPLGLLYFHQFPNYFLLSNLIVVPLSTAILVTGLGVLALSFIPAIAFAAGYCLERMIRLLNASVFTMEEFPLSITDGIFITPVQCVLIIFLILALLALFEYRKFRYCVIASVLVASCAALQWWHFFHDINVRKVAIYKVPGHSAIDLIDCGQTYFLTDPVLRHDTTAIRFHIAPHRLLVGVNKVYGNAPFGRVLKGCTLIGWHGRKILVVTEESFHVPEGMMVDWLVIANNALRDAGQVSRRITCGKVILDSSNSFFFASRFLEAAKLHNLDVHSVLHQGAFVLELEKQDT